MITSLSLNRGQCAYSSDAVVIVAVSTDCSYSDASSVAAAAAAACVITAHSMRFELASFISRSVVACHTLQSPCQ